MKRKKKKFNSASALEHLDHVLPLGFLPPCVSHSSNWQFSPDLAEMLKKKE